MENTGIQQVPAASESGTAASTPYLPFPNVYQYNNGFGGVRHGFNSYGRSEPSHLFSGTISEDQFARHTGMDTNWEEADHQGYAGQAPHLPSINDTQNLAPRIEIPFRQAQTSRRPSPNEDIRMTTPAFRQASRPSLNDDIRMTTPGSSRRQSQIIALLSQSAPRRPDGGICVCQPDIPVLPSPKMVGLAREAMDAVPLYHTTPSNKLRINYLLNTNVNVESASPARLQHTTPQVQQAAGPGSRLPHPSISLSLSSLGSGESTITGTGILSITEERFHLLNNLYYICVDASAMYIRSLRPVFARCRFRDHMRSKCHHHRRYHPYRSRSPRVRSPDFGPGASRRRKPPFENGAGSGRFSKHGEVDMDRRTSVTYNDDHRYHYHHHQHSTSPSLMDNISTISTHLWRTARADPLAPRRAEADAVTDMRDLYRWGEIIARGIHIHDESSPYSPAFLDTTINSLSSSSETGLDLEMGMGVEVEDEIGEGVRDGKWEGEGGLKCKRTARAARKLCSWIGDGMATNQCRGILGELRELRRVEVGNHE